MRDAVEVALEVGVHHMGVALLEPASDGPQRVLATSSRSEPVTRVAETALEDRLDNALDRCLDHSVLDGGDAQRTAAAARFGYLHTAHGFSAVLPCLELFRNLAQVLRGLGLK